jgi:hypothetical protein
MAAEANAIVFDPKGVRFAVGEVDQSVRLFDASDLIGTIEGGGSVVAFSPDGAHLAAASRDGVASIFPTRLPDVVSLACRMLRDSEHAAKFATVCKEGGTLPP